MFVETTLLLYKKPNLKGDLAVNAKREYEKIKIQEWINSKKKK